MRLCDAPPLHVGAILAAQVLDGGPARQEHEPGVVAGDGREGRDDLSLLARAQQVVSFVETELAERGDRADQARWAASAARPASWWATHRGAEGIPETVHGAQVPRLGDGVAQGLSDFESYVREDFLLATQASGQMRPTISLLERTRGLDSTRSSKSAKALGDRCDGATVAREAAQGTVKNIVVECDTHAAPLTDKGGRLDTMDESSCHDQGNIGREAVSRPCGRRRCDVPSLLADVDALQVGEEDSVSSPTSRAPKLECLRPPKGKWAKPPRPGRLTWIMPAWMRSTKPRARPMSRVNTEAHRP